MSVNYAQICSYGIVPKTTKIHQNNTNGAFDNCLLSGKKIFSVSIMLLNDKSLICNHDEDGIDILGYHFNIKNSNRNTMSTKIIPRINPNGIVYETDEKFLFLDEFLDFYQNKDVVIFLDIKCRASHFDANRTAIEVLNATEKHRSQLNKTVREYYQNIFFDCDNPFVIYNLCKHIQSLTRPTDSCKIGFDYSNLGCYVLNKFYSYLSTKCTLDNKYKTNVVFIQKAFYTPELTKINKDAGRTIVIWDFSESELEALKDSTIDFVYS